MFKTQIVKALKQRGFVEHYFFFAGKGLKQKMLSFFKAVLVYFNLKSFRFYCSTCKVIYTMKFKEMKRFSKCPICDGLGYSEKFWDRLANYLSIFFNCNMNDLEKH